MFSFTGFCLFTEVTVPIYTASAGHQSFNTLHYFEKGIAYAVLEFPNFLPSLWTTKITAVYYHTQAVHIILTSIVRNVPGVLQNPGTKGARQRTIDLEFRVFTPGLSSEIEDDLL